MKNKKIQWNYYAKMELIEEIKARKYWVILVALCAIIASVIYNNRVPFVYESTVSFFVDDDEAQGLKFNETDLILSKTSNISRLYNFSKSTEMIDHLVNKFNLYDHFNIDPSSEMHYERITATLMRNITIQQNLFNSISITVKDENKVLAAEMANEIFNKLDSMNKDFIVKNIERKINIYDQLLSSIKKQSFEQVEQLRSLVDECNQLVVNNERSRLKDYNLISELKVNFAMLTSQLSSVNNDLLKTSRVYGISVATLQKENIPNLRLINKALPDTRSPSTIAVSWTFAIAFAAIVVTLIIIILLHEYKFHVKAIFQ